MPNLHTKLAEITKRFADDLLDAIRSASLDELVGAGSGAPRGGPGRRRVALSVSTSPRPAPDANGRGRRSPDEVEAVLGRVVAALKVGSMRAEEIMKALGVSQKELPRVIKLGLRTKAIKRKGNKRATVYSAAT
jgi:hypothetical protein